MIIRLTVRCVAAWTGATMAAPAAARGRLDTGPPIVSPTDIRFRAAVLRPGTPAQAGLLPGPVEQLTSVVERYLVAAGDHPGHPAYAGAVLLAARDGVVVRRVAVGTAVRYSAVGPPPDRTGVELPTAEQLPARPDTIFDLASVSKLFTTIAALQQVECGRVDLDAPVARYVPEFAAAGKATVPVRFELNNHSYMDGLASPVTFGHTGFTGTSVVVDPLSRSFVILLRNRVHPDRGWGSHAVVRRAVARGLADAARLDADGWAPPAT